jgi:hypothetical protein
LGSELKGETIPFGEHVLSYTRREPLGVVRRHHPVERASPTGCSQDWPRALRRQHARLEGRRGCTARRPDAR